MLETVSRRGRPKGSGIDDSERLAAIANLLTAHPELKPTTAIKSLGISDPSTIRRLRDKFAEVRNGLAADISHAGEHTALTGAQAVHSITAADTEPKRARTVAARARTASRRVADAPAAVTTLPTYEYAAPPGAVTDKFASPATFDRPSVRTKSESKSKTTTSTTAGAASAPIMAEPPTTISAGTARIETAQPAIAEAAANLETAAAPAPTTDRPATPRQSVAEDLVVSMFGLGVAAMSSALAAQYSFADKLVRMPAIKLALRQQLDFNELALRLAPRPSIKSVG